MTEPLNDRVWRSAQIIQDPHLLAKLAQRDLIATEAQYHPQCLLGLYYKASKMEKSVPQEDTEVFNSEINAESLALADVIAYVEDIRMSENTPAVFEIESTYRAVHCAASTSRCFSYQQNSFNTI